MALFGNILVHIFPHSDWTMNAERYSLSLRIQSKCGKMQTRMRTLNVDTFHIVLQLYVAGNIKVSWQYKNSSVYLRDLTDFFYTDYIHFFFHFLWHMSYLVGDAKRMVRSKRPVMLFGSKRRKHIMILISLMKYLRI